MLTWLGSPVHSQHTDHLQRTYQLGQASNRGADKILFLTGAVEYLGCALLLETGNETQASTSQGLYRRPLRSSVACIEHPTELYYCP